MGFLRYTPLLMLFVIFALPMTSYGQETVNRYFPVVETIPLDLADEIIFKVTDFVPLPQGYLLLIQQSFNGPCTLILKVDKKGKLESSYNKKGNGPGYLRAVCSLIVKDDTTFLAAESISPYLHEFTHDLQFVKTHRIKKGGYIHDLGKYWGVRATYYSNNRKYLLALYDKDTFQFNCFAYEVDEIPFLTQNVGDICRIDGNRFAGVYSNVFQINLFDSEFNHKGKLLDSVPEYVEKYVPYRSDSPPGTVDNRTIKWLNSWDKVHSIYCTEPEHKLILLYGRDMKTYYDIYTLDGKLLKGHLLPSEGTTLMNYQNGYFWNVTIENDDDEIFKGNIVKYRLNL